MRSGVNFIFCAYVKMKLLHICCRIHPSYIQLIGLLSICNSQLYKKVSIFIRKKCSLFMNLYIICTGIQRIFVITFMEHVCINYSVCHIKGILSTTAVIVSYPKFFFRADLHKMKIILNT